MILSLILTLNLIGAMPVENIVPAEQTVSEVYSVEQEEEASQEDEVSTLSEEVSLADVKFAIDETNELLETILAPQTINVTVDSLSTFYRIKSDNTLTYITNSTSSSYYYFNRYFILESGKSYTFDLSYVFNDTSNNYNFYYCFFNDLSEGAVGLSTKVSLSSCPTSLTVVAPCDCYIVFSQLRNSNSLSPAFFTNVTYSYSYQQTYSFSDIGDRLTSIDENYKAVNDRNLTEEDPEVQSVKGNKYELTMYQLQVVQNIILVLLLAINLCSIFIRRSRNG